MKKTLFPIVLVSALMTIISCDKSFDAQEEGLVASSETKTFTATIESDNTKTTLDGLNVNWNLGDLITIVDGSGNVAIYEATPRKDEATKADFTFVTGTAPTQSPYTAYYPSTIYDKGTLTLPATQSHGTFALNPMYASSTTTSLSFNNICSVLKITTGELPKGSIVSLYADKPLNGEFKIKFVTDKPFAALPYGNNKITLEGCSGTGPFYIAIPAQTYNEFTISVDDANTGTELMVMNFGDKGKALNRNTIYSTTFTPTTFKNIFSVSEKKQVFFSRGNLYCYVYKDSYVLDFEKCQWESAKAWDLNHVSHFYWTDKISTAAAQDYDIHDDSENFFADFEHPLTINGESGWYALTGNDKVGEWNYLINDRTMTGGMTRRTYWTTVNEVNGLIIFPDDYPSSLGTTASWDQMEEAGCVFLPAAGARLAGGVVAKFGVYGPYWSSTLYSLSNASNLHFDSDVALVTNSYYGEGCSVRLVRESK